MLAGSRIFLYNDLTPDQQAKERELRKKKPFLIKHHNYKDKKITIYKGKLWADRQSISDTDLQSAIFPSIGNRPGTLYIFKFKDLLMEH